MLKSTEIISFFISVCNIGDATDFQSSDDAQIDHAVTNLKRNRRRQKKQYRTVGEWR